MGRNFLDGNIRSSKRLLSNQLCHSPSTLSPSNHSSKNQHVRFLMYNTYQTLLSFTIPHQPDHRPVDSWCGLFLLLPLRWSLTFYVRVGRLFLLHLTARLEPIPSHLTCFFHTTCLRCQRIRRRLMLQHKLGASGYHHHLGSSSHLLT